MKNWTGQLFPLMLLGTLTALSFWLQAIVTGGLEASHSPVDDKPDAIAEHAAIRRFDEAGRVKYELTAPRIAHFPADDRTEVAQPTLTAFRANAAPITLVAKQAIVSKGGETIVLKDDVIATRPGIGKRPALIARMPDLTLQPEQGLATTASPVDITLGNSWVRGIGARIDHNASTFELQSQVRGSFVRSGAQP
ncbi:MAG: LPS export ABC transporter periplasmic protein LptC [Azonexus sp.]|nr:LPS export ABC transporter periplasmic protein LptC [Azonexus sp.]